MGGRRRRAAGRAAQRRCRAGPRLLRSWRHRADGDRRVRGVGVARSRPPAGRRGAPRRGGGRAGPWRRGAPAGLRRRRRRRGNRRDRGGGDGARAETSKRGPRGGPEARGTASVRRRGRLVRLRAGGHAWHEDGGGASAAGGPAARGPGGGGGTRGPGRRAAPAARGVERPRAGGGLRAARGAGRGGAARGDPAPPGGLPRRGSGLRCAGLGGRRRPGGAASRISAGAPRALRFRRRRSAGRGSECACRRRAAGRDPRVRGQSHAPHAPSPTPDRADSRAAGPGRRLAAGRPATRTPDRGPGRPRRRGRDRPARVRMGGHRPCLRRADRGAPMSLDAVALEVMAHAFASVAEEMGLVLIHSALSPNIRERRDCSAALFDAQGEMIAQAAHIPVHLGAMADAVAAVRAQSHAPQPRPGEIFLLNDPYTGGTHLPDLTLVGAIDAGGQIGGYSVVRAHHSDVGGMQPGSMPAGARELFAEGLVIPPVRLTAEVERVVLANVRTPAMRRGDLAAQRAAVERGADGLRALVARYGWAGVQRAARDLMDYAERRTRAALGRFTVAGPAATGWMEGDGGTDADLAITVRVDIREGDFHADFTGPAAAAAGHGD